MFGAEALLRPCLWKHIIGISPDSMIANEDKDGVCKIRLLAGSIDEMTISKISIPESIELGITFKSILVQCILWKGYFLKLIAVFCRYRIRPVVVGRLDHCNKRLAAVASKHRLLQGKDFYH